jgi:hypothetical protein
MKKAARQAQKDAVAARDSGPDKQRVSICLTSFKKISEKHKLEIPTDTFHSGVY